MKLFEYMAERLREKSTWAGLGTILALVGLELHPEVLAALSAVIIAILALWEVLRREGR
jgi:hypothetical protein